MNPAPQRNSYLILCYALIFLGLFCILGTIAAALYLKNGIIEKVSEPINVEGLGSAIQIDSINRQIEWKERDIETAKKLPDPDEERAKWEEHERKIRKLNKNVPVGNFWKGFVRDDEKIKKLEEEKQALIVKRDELAGKSRAREMKPRSLRDWFVDYDLKLFLGAVLPLGLFSLFLAPFPFGGKLPRRNPLSLTDFERRCVLFLAFAIVFSAFGFFLFLWIMTLIY